MDLTELKPKETSFTLRSVNRSFKMNPISLSDEVWLDDTFGPEEIKKVFTEMDMRAISRIVFRLMDTEDKLFFKAKEVTFVNEDGSTTDSTIGGVELLKNLISGNKEKLDVVNALLENIGLSRPKAKEESLKPTVKKKVAKKKVKKRK